MHIHALLLQMHKFLAGTAAIRPLVSVGKGVADLVLVPLKQYKRDGKVSQTHTSLLQNFFLDSCYAVTCVVTMMYRLRCVLLAQWSHLQPDSTLHPLLNA
jgi:hypothetical protein